MRSAFERLGIFLGRSWIDPIGRECSPWGCGGVAPPSAYLPPAGRTADDIPQPWSRCGSRDPNIGGAPDAIGGHGTVDRGSPGRLCGCRPTPVIGQSWAIALNDSGRGLGANLQGRLRRTGSSVLEPRSARRSRSPTPHPVEQPTVRRKSSPTERTPPRPSGTASATGQTSSPTTVIHVTAVLGGPLRARLARPTSPPSRPFACRSP